MVTNLAYLQRVTHDPGPNVVFVKATAIRRPSRARSRRRPRARRHDRQGHPASRRRRPSARSRPSTCRHQQDRGGVRARPRRRRRWALFVALGARRAAPASSRRWPRSAPRCARSAPSSGARRRSSSAPRSCLPPCSAGCSRRCSSRCSSTSSTRRPTTSRSLAVPRRARRRGVLGAAVAAALAALGIQAACRSERYCERNDRSAHPDPRGRPRAARSSSGAGCARRASARTASRAERSCWSGSRRSRRTLLIIDIGLPDADGRDLCQALRAQGIAGARCCS